MKTWYALVAGITATFLVGCASAPTTAQLATADYGRDLSAAECVAAAEKAIVASLKDPDSAKFRHGQCSKGNWSSIPIQRMPVAFGWLQVGEVNAKNSFGGYVGFVKYEVLVKNGEPVRWCVHDDQGHCFPQGR